MIDSTILRAGDRAKQLLTRGLGTPITLGMILPWWTLRDSNPILFSWKWFTIVWRTWVNFEAKYINPESELLFPKDASNLLIKVSSWWQQWQRSSIIHSKLEGPKYITSALHKLKLRAQKHRDGTLSLFLCWFVASLNSRGPAPLSGDNSRRMKREIRFI